jgi:hypothetical protein
MRPLGENGLGRDRGETVPQTHYAAEGVVAGEVGMRVLGVRGIAAMAACLVLGLTACGGDDERVGTGAPAHDPAGPAADFAIDAEGLPVLACTPGSSIEGASSFLAPDFKGGAPTALDAVSTYLERNYPRGFEAPPQELSSRPAGGTGYFALDADRPSAGRTTLGYMINDEVVAAFGLLESTSGGGWAIEEYRMCADVSTAARQ